AHFVMLNLDAPAEAVKEMERQIGLSDDVIRHLTIRVDELEEGPSVQMRKADERRERRERRDRD
ncbi:MAG: 30S ribosomal protein S6, partial [Pacificimonas sp.]